jgi:hypothetical protein
VQVAELGGDVAPEIMANINWLAGARANFSTTQAGAGAQLRAAAPCVIVCGRPWWQALLRLEQLMLLDCSCL